MAAVEGERAAQAGRAGQSGHARARILLVFGAVSGAVAVGTGAFAAHGLKAIVTPERLAVFDTAARYELVHAVALLALGAAALARPHRLWWIAGLLMMAGTVIFSGSLYLLVLTEVRALGAITPVGGVAFIAGWLVAALAAWRALAPGRA